MGWCESWVYTSLPVVLRQTKSVKYIDCRMLNEVRRYFKKFPHFFVCRVIVSVRLLKPGSTVHHILIV